MTSSSRPVYIEVDGFRLPEEFLPKCYRFAATYEPEPNDIIVATYPKCGTTWMCQIVKLIQEKGNPFTLTPDEYFKHFPFLEMFGEDGIRKRMKPGCIKTHLPFDRLNFSEQAKYIYVVRHPRDCLVSFYHHTRYFPTYRFSDGYFEDFFELFIEGNTDFNGFFENLLPWYEERHRQNIFFTTFESLKSEPRKVVQEIADFLECSLTETQMNQVLKYSSFEWMKKDTDAMYENFSETSINEEVENRLRELERKALEDGYRPVGEFIRKGQVGDGKIVLSEEQENRFKTWILEKSKGSDVMSLWQNI